MKTILLFWFTYPILNLFVSHPIHIAAMISELAFWIKSPSLQSIGLSTLSVLCIAVVPNASTISVYHACALSAQTRALVSVSASATMVTMGGDLQPGCLADRLLTGLGQPAINKSISSKRKRKSATHLWLAATPLSLPGAGTVYSDILGLIVLHVNMTRQINRIRDLTWHRVS